MPDPLTERFEKALHVAQEMHDTDAESDDDSPPHTSHLLQVAGLVLEAGGDEDEAIAALLHDALESASNGEEAEARESRIRDDFGDRPADIVVACTDGAIRGGDTDGWKARKEEYIHSLWTGADEATVRVSAADALQTARTLLRDYRSHGESAWSRYEGGRSGTLWYYRALVGAYRYRDMDGQIDELDAIVSTLEEETNLA